MKTTNMKQSAAKKAMNVYQAENGRHYIVKSTPELGILKSLGIMKDVRILKKLTHHLGGPVLLMVETSEIAIGKDIAEKIMVEEMCEHGNVS